MSTNSTIGGKLVATQDYVFGGGVQVNGGTIGTGFQIVDPTDATKVMVFDLSSLTTGTTTTFAPSAGGAEVTETGTQTISNKTLLDTSTSIANTSSPTKKFQFLASGITAGQTRVLSVPDSNGTIAYLSGSTFVSTTLTSPTINGATLTGSISGGTVAPTILTVPASTSLTTPTIAGATISGTFTSTATISGGTVAPTTLTVPSGTSLPAPVVTTSLTVNSTTGVFLPPRMTGTERDAIATPTKGSIIYNTSTDQMNYYDGAWQIFAKV